MKKKMNALRTAATFASVIPVAIGATAMNQAFVIGRGVGKISGPGAVLGTVVGSVGIMTAGVLSMAVVNEGIDILEDTFKRITEHNKK